MAEIIKHEAKVLTEIRAENLHSLLCALTIGACHYHKIGFDEGLTHMSLGDSINYIASLPSDRVIRLTTSKFNDNSNTFEFQYITSKPNTCHTSLAK